MDDVRLLKNLPSTAAPAARSRRMTTGPAAVVAMAVGEERRAVCVKFYYIWIWKWWTDSVCYVSGRSPRG